LLLSNVRLYHVVVKVSVLREKRRAASSLRGHVIFFMQDGQECAAKTLLERVDQLREAFSISVVGVKDEITEMERELMRQLRCLRVRPEVVYNYLLVQAQLSKAAGCPDLCPSLPDFEQVHNALNSLPERLVDEAHVIAEESDAANIERISTSAASDVAGVREGRKALPDTALAASTDDMAAAGEYVCLDCDASNGDDAHGTGTCDMVVRLRTARTSTGM